MDTIFLNIDKFSCERNFASLVLQNLLAFKTLQCLPAFVCHAKIILCLWVCQGFIFRFSLRIEINFSPKKSTNMHRRIKSYQKRKEQHPIANFFSGNRFKISCPSCGLSEVDKSPPYIQTKTLTILKQFLNIIILEVLATH